MVKRKSVGEEDLIEHIDDDEEVEVVEAKEETTTEAKEAPKEETAEKTEVVPVDDPIADLAQEDTSPDSIIDLVQSVNSAAIKQAVAQSDALTVAVELKDVLKNAAQISTQQKRAEAENSKGASIQAVADAIAQNNSGLNTKKRIDESPAETETKNTNIRNAKPNFGSNIPNYEKETNIEVVSYEELEAKEQEINDAKKQKKVNKS